MRRHVKHYGFVDWLERDSWWGRIELDGEILEVEFQYDELPEGKGEGHYFVLHKTKAGRWYFYWPERLESNAKRKKRLKEARKIVANIRRLGVWD